MSNDARPVRRFERDPSAALDGRAWPCTLAPVRQLLEHGLDLPAGITFLVGENGSGKSTVVEALAEAYGLNPEGGSRGARHSTRVTESPLGAALRVVKSPSAGIWSYFLRAEAMHGFYTYNEQTFVQSNLPVPPSERFHERSHGEGFLDILRQRFDAPGFYLMDEPESALSFQSCLALLALLSDLARTGAQVVIATHSPVLASLPGATVLELGDHGIRSTTWEDLQLVADWRSYLERPERWLRHLVDPS